MTRTEIQQLYRDYFELEVVLAEFRMHNEEI